MNQDWEVKVISSTDWGSVMAVLATAQQVQGSVTASDVGGGTVTLDSNDPVLGQALPPGITATTLVNQDVIAADDFSTHTSIHQTRLFTDTDIGHTNLKRAFVDVGSNVGQFMRISFTGTYTFGTNLRIYMAYEDDDNCIFVDINWKYTDLWMIVDGDAELLGRETDGGPGSNGGITGVVFYVEFQAQDEAGYYRFKISYSTSKDEYLPPLLGYGEWRVSTVPTSDWVEVTIAPDHPLPLGTKVGFDSTVASRYNSTPASNVDRETGTSLTGTVDPTYNYEFQATGRQRPDVGNFPVTLQPWQRLKNDSGVFFQTISGQVVMRANWDSLNVLSTNWRFVDVDNAEGSWSAQWPIASPAFAGLAVRVEPTNTWGFYINHNTAGFSGPGGSGPISMLDITGSPLPFGFAGASFAAGDVLRVDMVGNNFKVYCNGVFSFQFNDNRNRVCTLMGIACMRYNNELSYDVDRPGGGNPALSEQMVANPTYQGKITIPITRTPINILEDENLVIGYKNGVAKFGFLMENIKENVIQEDGGTSTVISGRGPAAVLEWGKVFPGGYPTPSQTQQIFKSTAAFKVWLLLLQECQDRGTLLFINCTFTDTEDSNGLPWSDATDLTVDAGTTLLDLLSRWCAQIGAEWSVDTNFNINVYQQPGNHLESTVQFLPAANTLSQARERDRTKIGNLLVAHGDKYFAIRQDNASIAKFHQRESYVEAGDAKSSTQVAIVAEASITEAKGENFSFTIKVVADDPLQPMFDAYNTLDWVHVEADDTILTGDYRIAALTIQLGDTGVDGEVTLQSKRDLALLRLQRQIDGLGGSNSSGQASSALPGSQAAANISIFDLIDVSAGSITSGQILKWNGTSFSPYTIPPIPKYFDDLTDVDLTGLATGNAPIWNGTTWVAGAVSGTSSSWYIASGVPGSGLGVDGDHYLNVDDGELWSRDSVGWNDTGYSLKGDPGPIGLTGSAGMSGFPPYMMTGSLAVKTGRSRLYADRTQTIDTIRASVGTAPGGASVIVDIFKNGTSIFTTTANRPTISPGTNTATGIPDVTGLVAGDYLTVSVVQVGTTATGSDLTVQVNLV